MPRFILIIPSLCQLFNPQKEEIRKKVRNGLRIFPGVPVTPNYFEYRSGGCWPGISGIGRPSRPDIASTPASSCRGKITRWSAEEPIDRIYLLQKKDKTKHQSHCSIIQ